MMPPVYDPLKTYEENFKEGPFGNFADGSVFKNSGEPKFEFLGQKVFCPFGIAAGPLINGRFMEAALDKGFDIVTYKTVRTGSYGCNPWPNVVQVKAEKVTLEAAEKGMELENNFHHPLTITNSFGVPSQNPDFWQKDLADCVEYAKNGQVVIGSFQGTPRGDEAKYIQDFANCARLVKETGVKILEVNLSCPNEGTAKLLCFDVERVNKVVDVIKNEIGNTPLVIKLAHYKEQAVLEKLVELVGRKVEAIEAINTIYSKIVDGHGGPGFKDGRKFSGVCGAGIKWAGLEMTQRLHKLRQERGLKFAIIGVGGVMSARDYSEFMSAGADAIMCATGAMWNPFLAQEIKKIVV